MPVTAQKFSKLPQELCGPNGYVSKGIELTASPKGPESPSNPNPNQNTSNVEELVAPL